MSFQSVPSVEEVSKWSPKNVITFLETKKDELFLRDRDIKVFEDNWVAGRAFLELSKDDLLASPYNLPDGPARAISGLIKDVKGEREAQKLRDEDEDDALYFSTIDMLQTPPEYIPSRWDLLLWLQKPPSTPVNIPPAMYNAYFRSRISPNILSQFFVTSDKASFRTWAECIQPIAKPPVIGTTEDSFHAFWDALIVNPFR
ncbi:1091_t:CDS:2, partial [Paraglomus brasilianum]